MTNTTAITDPRDAARHELEPIEWSCELLADETGEMDLTAALTEEN